MCCLFTTLVFLGPRFGILIWWLLDPLRFDATFGPNWVIILLFFLFLPWTLLMYLVVAPLADMTTAVQDFGATDPDFLRMTDEDIERAIAEIKAALKRHNPPR